MTSSVLCPCSLGADLARISSSAIHARLVVAEPGVTSQPHGYWIGLRRSVWRSRSAGDSSQCYRLVRPGHAACAKARLDVFSLHLYKLHVGIFCLGVRLSGIPWAWGEPQGRGDCTTLRLCTGDVTCGWIDEPCSRGVSTMCAFSEWVVMASSSRSTKLLLQLRH